MTALTLKSSTAAASAHSVGKKSGSGVRFSLQQRPFTPHKSHSRQSLQTVASLGGGKDDEKRFITREEEPDQFWQTKTEKKGQNPVKDPLAIIGILGLLIPFIILGIAIGTGVVDIEAGKP